MVFASAAPTVAENPQNNWQGMSDRLGRINVQPQVATVNTFVNHVAHNIDILKIRPPAPPLRRLGQLRSPDRHRDDQHQRGDDEAPRYNLNPARSHTADAILFTTKRPAPKAELQKPAPHPASAAPAMQPVLPG